MRISSFKIHRVPAGWRDWLFLTLVLDDGSIGQSEFTESNGLPASLVAGVGELVRRFGDARFEDPIEVKEALTRSTLQSSGGIAKKAISAIENALWDAVSNSCAKPLSKILGLEKKAEDPFLSSKIYWSHFPTTRVRAAPEIGVTVPEPSDLASLGLELKKNHIPVFKSNILDLENEKVLMPGFSLARQRPIGITDLNKQAHYFSKIQAGSGGSALPALDLNYNFLSQAMSQECIEALQAMKLAWLEIDVLNLQDLERLRLPELRICSGENILNLLDYRNLIESGLVDQISIDLLWLGLSDSIEVARMADSRGIPVYLHNYYSDFASSMALSFVDLGIAKFGLLEYDPDDVSWRSEISMHSLSLLNGTLSLERRLGWSNSLNHSSPHVLLAE